MPDNKLIIRRLPPSMSEDKFLKHVSPLPDYDYLAFFEANCGLGPHSFSRAYINFLDPADMAMFRERFDNYVFVDNDGHEYSAVVEPSLWHKTPKDGPFYKSNQPKSSTSKVSEEHSDQIETKETPCDSSIENDPDFIKFISKLHTKRTHQSPIQTLEANLDELTGSGSSTSSNVKDNSSAITPLIGYVNQKRNIEIIRRNK